MVSTKLGDYLIDFEHDSWSWYAKNYKNIDIFGYKLLHFFVEFVLEVVKTAKVFIRSFSSVSIQILRAFLK